MLYAHFWLILSFHAGCTLSPSAFREILERELLETRLCECDFLHSCCELSILPGIWIEKKTIKNQRRQLGEIQEPLTRTPQTAKKVRADEAKHKRPRLYESIQGKCFHLHSRSRLISGSLDESVQSSLDSTETSKRALSIIKNTEFRKSLSLLVILV